MISLWVVLSPNFGDFRFESNMTSVRPLSVAGAAPHLMFDAETTSALQLTP